MIYRVDFKTLLKMIASVVILMKKEIVGNPGSGPRLKQDEN